MKLIDMTGERFGRLVVVGRAPFRPGDKGARWVCRCDCGGYTVVSRSSLVCGTTCSCGCLKNELSSQRLKKQLTTHGLSKERLYNTWKGIKRRCYKEHDRGFKHYGARGISMCEEWRKDYLVFREWAYASGYADNLTIERIDVNGNYCPENCKWIPLEDQLRNRRNMYRYKGKSISTWANELGLDRQKVYDRVHKQGWSIEEALELVPHEYPYYWKTREPQYATCYETSCLCDDCKSPCESCGRDKHGNQA